MSCPSVLAPTWALIGWASSTARTVSYTQRTRETTLSIAHCRKRASSVYSQKSGGGVISEKLP